MAQNLEYVKGAKEIEEALMQLPDYVARRIAFSALYAGGDIVRAEMERSAPVLKFDSKTVHAPHTVGFLKSQIMRAGTKGRGYPASVVIGPSKDAFYGAYGVLGTKHQAAKDWIGPAFQRSVGPALQAIMDRLVKGISNYAKQQAKRVRW